MQLENIYRRKKIRNTYVFAKSRLYFKKQIITYKHILNFIHIQFYGVHISDYQK